MSSGPNQLLATYEEIPRLLADIPEAQSDTEWGLCPRRRYNFLSGSEPDTQGQRLPIAPQQKEVPPSCQTG